jgi:hypothetical protein
MRGLSITGLENRALNRKKDTRNRELNRLAFSSRF